jgi:hypothetical protein
LGTLVLGAVPGGQRFPPPDVYPTDPEQGQEEDGGMAFFRTRDRRRDRSIALGAREQRREQLQVQLQMQAAQKAALALPEQLEPAGAAE